MSDMVPTSLLKFAVMPASSGSYEKTCILSIAFYPVPCKDVSRMHVYRGVRAIRIAALASAIILLGAGFAFAADTDSGTAGRPTAVLSEADCIAAWHTAAGAELTRFHRGHDSLSPAIAKGIVTNFQQADTDKDGSISRAEFTQACKLGLVTSGLADRNIVADDSY